MWIGFGAGVLTGFGLAIPPGPINFAVFERGMRNQRAAAFSLALGGVAGDSLYLLAALLYQLATEWVVLVNIFFGTLGGLFLIALGVWALRRNHPPPGLALPGEVAPRHPSLLLTGLAMALANPFFIVTMIAVTELYFSLGVLRPELGPNLAFTIGFLVGTLIWLTSIGQTAFQVRHRIAPAAARIGKLCGLAYIAFGLYMLAKSVRLLLPGSH